MQFLEERSASVEEGNKVSVASPKSQDTHRAYSHGCNQQPETVKADGTVLLSCSSENFAKSYVCTDDNESD